MKGNEQKYRLSLLIAAILLLQIIFVGFPNTGVYAVTNSIVIQTYFIDKPLVYQTNSIVSTQRNITVSLDSAATIRIDLQNLKGQKIKTLLQDTAYTSGNQTYKVSFDDVIDSYSDKAVVMLTAKQGTIVTQKPLLVKIIDMTKPQIGIYPKAYYGFFLTKEKKLYQWGDSSSGYTSGYVNNINNIHSIYSKNHNKYALTHEGKLYVWGSNIWGALGVGHYDKIESPILNPTLSNKVVVQIDGGTGDNAMALTTEGKVYTFGANYTGQLGVGDKEERYIPTEVTSLTNKGVIEVVNAGHHCFALLSDGSLYAWGHNCNGGLGVGDKKDKSVPVEVKDIKGQYFTNIYFSGYYTFATDVNGKIYGFGDNRFGQLGLGDKVDRTTPTELSFFSNKKIKDIQVLDGTNYALTEDGKLYGWGYNEWGQLGLGDNKIKTSPTDIAVMSKKGVKQIVYIGRTFAVTKDKKVYAWGGNYSGELGLGDKINRNVPTEITSLSNANVIHIDAASDNGTYASAEDGKVYVWGPNTNGVLGLGDKQKRLKPVVHPLLSELSGYKPNLKQTQYEYLIGNPYFAFTADAELQGKWRVEIINSKQEIIKTLTQEVTTVGEISFPWDGKDEKGNIVAVGTYTVKLFESNIPSNSIPLTVYYKEITENEWFKVKDFYIDGNIGMIGENVHIGYILNGTHHQVSIWNNEVKVKELAEVRVPNGFVMDFTKQLTWDGKDEKDEFVPLGQYDVVITDNGTGKEQRYENVITFSNYPETPIPGSSEPFNSYTFSKAFPDEVLQQYILKNVGASEDGVHNISWEIVTPQWIAERITELQLNQQNIMQLKGIEYLSQLETLEIHGTKVSKLPNEIAGLKKLSTIDIGETAIKGLPEVIFQMNWIENLNIAKLNISELTTQFSLFKQLKTLDASFNSINEFPKYMTQMLLVKKLVLKNNRIMTLPTNIDDMAGIEELDISNNYLYSLPPYYPPKLSKFNIDGNCIPGRLNQSRLIFDTSEVVLDEGNSIDLYVKLRKKYGNKNESITVGRDSFEVIYNHTGVSEYSILGALQFQNRATPPDLSISNMKLKGNKPGFYKVTVKLKKSKALTVLSSVKVIVQSRKPSLTGVSIVPTSNQGFSPGGSNLMKIKYELIVPSGAAAKVKVDVVDAKNTVVAVLQNTTTYSIKTGTKTLYWNGKATSGNSARLKIGTTIKAGTYKVRFMASNRNGTMRTVYKTIRIK